MSRAEASTYRNCWPINHLAISDLLLLLRRERALREAAVGAQPSDLTGTLQFGSSDGDMFSVIRHGTSKDMESYAERLSETDTWNVINYVRSLRGR